MKRRVMQIIFTLSHGGAERLGLTILDGMRDSVSGSVCGVFGDGGPLERILQEMNIPYVSIDAGRKGKLASMKELYSLLKNERIDLVHVQAGYLLLYVLIPAKLARVKIIYTEHAKHSIETKPMIRYFIKLAAPFLDAITTVSLDLMTFFREYLGQPEKRLEHIPNAVDTVFFSPEGESMHGTKVTNGRFVFGSVARMTEAKDHGNLLRAFRRVRNLRDDVLLVLVGDGETRSDVTRMVEELDLRESVLMLGHRDNIPNLLRAMDVFVLPSRREGAPISVLEAMGCGLPVVATDVGGVTEFLQDGENSRIVPPRNHEALAEAMLWMLDNPEKMEAFAAIGPKIVAERFSNHHICLRYLHLYERVLT